MATGMPVIGVIGRNSERSLPGDGAANAHPDFVEVQGGVPRVINNILKDAGTAPITVPPFTEDYMVDHYMGMMQGLVFFGGSDLHPTRSGIRAQDQTERLGMDYDDPRDVAEIKYMQAAMRWGMPVLAFCRGSQIMNVAAGGTLRVIDHLTAPNLDPADPNNHLWYDHPHGVYAHGHPVNIRFDGSDFANTLATAVGGKTIRHMSSAHHHAIDELGSGLAVVGVSPGLDPVTEIIADESGSRVGFQGVVHVESGACAAASVRASKTSTASVS